MPYITPEDRSKIDEELYKFIEHMCYKEPTAGMLNYIFTKIAWAYLNEIGGIGYGNINEVIGVLECTKQEFYRRIATPYEDAKIKDNGDVY